MGRCNNCEVCAEVAAFKKANKTNKKKIKRFETANKCTNPTLNTRKRRINEVEQLGEVAVQGGQVRQEYGGVLELNDSSLDPSERSSRPQRSLKEDTIFDADKFDEYLKAVKKCSELGTKSSNKDVRDEAESMIPKMQRLMDADVKYEVDFGEAVQDLSNIYLWWMDDQPAGTRAFIPDLRDREICLAALQIYSCAAEEAKQIPKEYCEEFGYEGLDMYNEMVSMIGEQEKRCLPFVNMCLRAWMKRLSEDVDWSNLDVLDFEKWAHEEIEKPVQTDRIGRTSYELMMSIFGKEESDAKDASANEAKQPSAPRNTLQSLWSKFLFFIIFCISVGNKSNVAIYI